MQQKHIKCFISFFLLFVFWEDKILGSGNTDIIAIIRKLNPNEPTS